MKKIIITVLMWCVLALCLTGCGKTNAGLEIGKKSDISPQSNGVSISIKDGTLTNEGTTVILKNDTDKLLRYTEEYYVEVKQDNDWYNINAVLTFTEPLWGLEPHEEKEINLNWEYGYGKLPTGKYRIVKNVYFENEKDQKFYVSAEFNIDSD